MFAAVRNVVSSVVDSPAVEWLPGVGMLGAAAAAGLAALAPVVVDGSSGSSVAPGAAAPAAVFSPAVPAEGSLDERFRAEFYGALNSYRASLGLSPVAPDGVLERQSREWSADMLSSGSFRHSSSSRFDYHGEIIAMKFPVSSGVEFFEMWRNSPGHDRIMRGADFRSVGFGLAAGPEGGASATYATAQFKR